MKPSVVAQHVPYTPPLAIFPHLPAIVLSPPWSATAVPDALLCCTGLAAAHGDGGRWFVEMLDSRSKCRVGGGTGIATAAAATVVLTVMNKVLYKLMLVPMRNYSFFLAHFTTSG
jgi:hypothetical protein